MGFFLVVFGGLGIENTELKKLNPLINRVNLQHLMKLSHISSK